MTHRLYSTKLFLFAGLPVAVMLLLLTVGGSRLLIDPTAATVTPCGDVVIRRHYPMSELFNSQRPWVRHVQTVIPMTPGHNGGYACREGNGHGQRYGHDRSLGYGAWNIRHFAASCMNDPVGFIYDVQWIAYLFDALPLRPVSLEVKVVTVGTNCDTEFQSESHEPR